MQTTKELVSNLQIEITLLDPSDIEKFDQILREHARDRQTGEIQEDEIADIKRYMAGGMDKEGRIRQYLVAKGANGQAYGCMAISEPDSDMKRHFNITGENESELLNAFVSSEVFRGGGVGKQLFEAICNLAKSQGKTTLLIHSGPRYKNSWGFYDRFTDSSTGFLVEKYGKGGDAKTWTKRL
jgi:predicted N-acetyltransferase YhbS